MAEYQTLPSSLPQRPIPNRLESLVALVTGAAGNIGFETARRLLLEGSKVVLVDLDADRLANAAESLRNELKDSKHQTSPDEVVLTVQADVTSDEHVQRCVSETIQKFDRLDIAFLCAGISYSSTSILETEVDQYDKVMSVNCRSGKSASLLASHIYRLLRWRWALPREYVS
ncbi:hypothetical protein BDV59DRAFT_183322 [Aspergillus ambiguus]|uniref:SDR family NAD(P)-dependent oxidoreductase n=1 Tax=Aspergillus ambiguus TaxID=176160 RepID=UPI003CCDB583